MKIRKKIGDLGKEQIQQLLQDFLDELGEGAVALLEHFEERDCPEYLAVELDEEEKIVSFTAKDGSHYVYNLKSETIDALAQAISDLADEVHNIHQLENFENIEDPEGRLQIGKDPEDKIFNYRKPDGTLVENAGIETNHLELTEQGMTDFQQALKDAGFTPGGGGDWSDRENIELPEPKHYALLNINIDSLPVSSGDIREALVQYYDGLGNYFKMDAEIEIQGQSSKSFAETGGKGNYTLDLPKDVKFGNWVPQDSFHLKGSAKDVVRGILPTSYKWAYLIQEYLGSKPNRVLIDESDITTTHATGDRINDWPTDARCLPDGFPCELYVNGEYHGLYSWQLKKHRKNYSMDKKDYTSFFIDADSVMTNDYQHGIWNDGPDSAPASGVGTWWNGFDIKGPSGLVSMNGEEFDGDAPIELMGSDNVYQKSFTLNNVPTGYSGGDVVVSIGSNTYTISTTASMSAEDIIDAIVAGNYTNSRYACYKAKASTTAYKAVFKDLDDGRLNPPEPTIVSTDINPLTFVDKVESIKYDTSIKAHKNSNITKGLIRTFSTRYLEVKALIEAEDTEQAKAKFNEYFDYDACMLVYIYNCLMKNGDSIKKNTLWGMYKEGKIFPALWDLDGMYGTGWVGDSAGNPSSSLWNGVYATSEWPLKLFWTLYETEIKAIYSALRDAKKIDINTWHDIVFNQWVNRIGEEAYKRDIKKWPETPSYRENYTDTEHWVQLGWTSVPGNLPVWTEGTTYNEGTTVVIRIHPAEISSVLWMMYRALVTTNTCPVTKFYTEFPVVGGFYDSPKRWQKWMEEQIKLCDIQNDYFEELLADFTAYRANDEGYEIECTNMTIDTKLSKTYNYIQGHITRHEIEVEGQTVSTYTIDGGIEAPEDTSKHYTRVKEAIEAAASQPVDVPSENVYYIQARAKDINYHKK